MQEKNLLEATTGGWVAMLEHYFVSAWVPDQQADNQLYSLVRNGQGVIGAKGPAVNIEPGATVTLGSTFTPARKPRTTWPNWPMAWI